LRTVALLGSTGSIGTQAVEVARGLEDVSVRALAAASNGELMAEQARLLGVKVVALSDRDAARKHAPLFEDIGVKLLAGPEGVLEIAALAECDLVLNAIVGSAGLDTTLAVLQRGADLALANKESLVAGGRLVTDMARSTGAAIVPVDSEHSAIYQCLLGEDKRDLRRIILTASGGPFRERPPGSLDEVTVAETLAHPTWNMGPKVTVDSATLMNKGLEVIEAHHLFDVDMDRIDVVIHPQSVVHSMVEMVDGSVLAHMGVPDMRIPVQYAMTRPRRAPSPVESLSLASYGELTFFEVDGDKWPALGLAYEAARRGGTCPAAMNAANEEAVAAFLAGQIGFTDVMKVVNLVLDKYEPLRGKTLDEIRDTESASRRQARLVIEAMEKKS
jgi:1-deoxy-D-xylulose-5-phosphate reductoisomerase